MLMFFSFSTIALLFAYVEWRCVLLWQLPLWFKLSFSAFLAMGIFNLPVVLFYGQYLPKWLNLTFAVAGLLLIYLPIATVILDVLRAFAYKSVYISYTLTSLCIVLAAYAVWASVRLPMVKNIEIASNVMPQNYKIVHLSDFHIGQGFDGVWLEKVVDKVNALNPNIILITGDSIDNTVPKLLPQMQSLKKLQAPVYMVFGNHEYYYGALAWQKAFTDMGIMVLHNNHVTIDGKFVLGGGDWGAWRGENQDANVAQTFKGADKNLPKIFMSHYPAAFGAAKDNGVFLQLSGHTHGGMTFPINLITKHFNGGYLRGLYYEDGAYLYVSDGTGLWNGLPARIGSQNEIAVIGFKPN